MINLPPLPDFKITRPIQTDDQTTERQQAIDLFINSIEALVRYDFVFSTSTLFWNRQDTHVGRCRLRTDTATWWNTNVASLVSRALAKRDSIARHDILLTNIPEFEAALRNIAQSVELDKLVECARFFCEQWLVELQARFKRSLQSVGEWPKANEATAHGWPGWTLAEWRINCFSWFRDEAMEQLRNKIGSGDSSTPRDARANIEHLILERLKADASEEAKVLQNIQSQIHREKQREVDKRKAELEREELLRVLQESYASDLAHDYIKTASTKDYGRGEVVLDSTTRHTVEQDFVRRWFENLSNVSLKHPLTTEQIKVISRIADHLLVRARAGSGKTTTIVSRVLFLIRHCGVDPESILLFAFNKKAAQKLERDLVNALGLDRQPSAEAVRSLPIVQTFDGFAGSISGISLMQPSEWQHLIQEGVEDCLARDEESVKNAMLKLFRADWDRIASGILPGREAVLELRRSDSAFITLAGEQVKSRGEHRIANWLFENNIPYSYEKPVRQAQARWNPDFTLLPDSATPILVEYLGLQGEADYDRTTEWKKQQIADLPLSGRPLVVWLDPSSTRVQHGAAPKFISQLTEVLEQVHITPMKLTDDQIWQKVKLFAVSHFRQITYGVIERAQQLRWSHQHLSDKAQSTAVPQLLKLCAQVMQYVTAHNKREKRSYAEICWAAGDKLQKEEVTTTRLKSQSDHPRIIDIRTIQEVIVDEFQDYAQRFQAIVDGVLASASSARLVVVGDDWQAINRYAGSDPRFITSWDRAELTLTINHRSLAGIVDLGNRVMPDRGPSARAKKSGSQAAVLRLDIGDLTPNAIELEAVRAFTKIRPETIAAIGRLTIPHLRARQSVAVLARTNAEIDVVKNETDRTDSPLQSLIVKLAGSDSGHLEVSTVHSVKGQEFDVVVLLSDSFPLLHPLRVIGEVFGDTEPYLIEDERRLLYVGITRAKHTLYVLSGAKEQKVKWAKDLPISDGSWEEFPPVGVHMENSTRLAVVLSGTIGQDFKTQIKAAGFKGMGPPSWTWERLVISTKNITPTDILSELKREPWFPNDTVKGQLVITVVNSLGERLAQEVINPAPQRANGNAVSDDESIY